MNSGAREEDAEAGELLSETIDGASGGLYSRVITRKHEESLAGRLGRDIGFDIATEYIVDYAYDAQGWLLRIDGPGLPAGGVVYDRVRDGQQQIVSDLIATLTYEDGSANALASATRVYDDHRDLLESIENEESGTPVTISMYTYAYDGAGRRTSVVYTGSAFDPEFHVDFGYNTRGELTAADRREGTTPGTGDPLAADKHAFAYTYDPIGNRMTSNVDDSQTPTHYCANAVNQYEATAAAAGCATPAETFDYDADGNLTADGTMTYVWNGENRLIEAFPTSPAANDKKVEFKYDYLGRRVEKKVSIYTDGQWVEGNALTQRFVYGGPALDTAGTGTSQGWNVALVLDANNDTQRRYTWGLDLSGTVHAAGGIGGLLAVEETAAQGSPAYWYFYDGNGNVGQVIDASDKTIAARYEYDPYGNTIVAEGAHADTNPFRFSTKPFDAEIGAYYYIFRYYSPRLGRWLNRDPIEEWGGENLYGFVGGDPIENIDLLGLQRRWPPIEIGPVQTPRPPVIPRPPGGPWPNPIIPPDPIIPLPEPIIRPVPEPPAVEPIAVGPGIIEGALWWGGFIVGHAALILIPGHDEEPGADLRRLTQEIECANKKRDDCYCKCIKPHPNKPGENLAPEPVGRMNRAACRAWPYTGGMKDGYTFCYCQGDP